MYSQYNTEGYTNKQLESFNDELELLTKGIEKYSEAWYIIENKLSDDISSRDLQLFN